MALPFPIYTNKKMLITREAFDALILESILCDRIPDKAREACLQRVFTCSSSTGILLTNDLTELDADSEVIYYHPINGVILADQKWKFDWDEFTWKKLFSTRTFIRNLQDAERSTNVVAHFLHINSGGGEAWLLDAAAEMMKSCKKPIYAFIEQQCCSAAYFLTCNAQVIKTYNQHDIIGSIGCMVQTFNISGYLENLGIKQIEAYSTKSDLKNKRENDLLNGHPERYITERLDPHMAVFEKTVREARAQLSALPEDHEIFRGETYYANDAIALGLIDGLVPDLATAINEAYELGMSVKNYNKLLSNL